MHFKLLVVGRLKDRALQSRCDEFLKWLGPYAKVELRELPDSDAVRESQAILKALEKDRSWKVVLSEEGREFTSEAFAAQLAAIDRTATFIIGGPGGLSSEVKAQADLLWSLSKLTFTHELARLLLAEQLFRAVSIQRGSQYHIAGARP